MALKVQRAQNVSAQSEQEHYRTMTQEELVLQCMELRTQLQEQISKAKIVAFGTITGILAGVMFILLFC
jgi:hypothetical protein